MILSLGRTCSVRRVSIRLLRSNPPTATPHACRTATRRRIDRSKKIFPTHRAASHIAAKRDDGDKDEDYPRPRRRRPRPFDDDDLRPHRGTSVLVIGIISLAIFFSLPGLVLAIVALSLGLSDLGAMNRGEMMPDGRGQTKAGVTCAIVALSLELLLLVSCCGFGFFSNNF